MHGRIRGPADASRCGEPPALPWEKKKKNPPPFYFPPPKAPKKFIKQKKGGGGPHYITPVTAAGATRTAYYLDHRPKSTTCSWTCQGHQHGDGRDRIALVAHFAVSEAAVVGYRTTSRVRASTGHVTLMADREPTDALRKELSDWVRTEIGPIAKPDLIQFAPGLPKTRSGKIMRRILRKIAEDVSAPSRHVDLAEPAVGGRHHRARMNRQVEADGRAKGSGRRAFSRRRVAGGPYRGGGPPDRADSHPFRRRAGVGAARWRRRCHASGQSSSSWMRASDRAAVYPNVARRRERCPWSSCLALVCGWQVSKAKVVVAVQQRRDCEPL